MGFSHQEYEGIKAGHPKLAQFLESKGDYIFRTSSKKIKERKKNTKRFK
jgi:hypothetical protein